MSKKSGFGLGVAAGLLATGAMFLLRYAFDVPTVPELAQDAIVQLFPGQIASFIIDKLQKFAKLLLFATLFPAQLALLGLVGVLYTSQSRPRSSFRGPVEVATDWLRQPWRSPVAWGLVWWLLVGVVLFPNAGLGPFGSATINAAAVTAVAAGGPPLIFILGLMYGKGVIEGFVRRGQPEAEVTHLVLSRRRFLGLSLGAVASTVIGGSFLRAFVTGDDSPRAPLGVQPAGSRVDVLHTPTPTVVGHPGGPGVPASGIPQKPVTSESSPLPTGPCIQRVCLDW